MMALDDVLARFEGAGFDEDAVYWAREFLRSLLVERRFSENTVRAYAVDMRTYLDWAKRMDMNVFALDARAFRRYLYELNAAGYATKTVSRRLSAVRSFYAYLNERDVVDINPAEAVSSPKQEASLPRKTAASDIVALLSVCDASTPVGARDQAFLELLYATGCRISELAGVRCADIDCVAGELRVMGKGGKQRIVPVHRVACKAVDAYVRNGRAHLIERDGNAADALFVSTRGNAMSADALRRVFKTRARQAGLDASLHPHDIRHAYATDLVEGGADLRSVQELLGHSRLSTTQIYTHLSLSHMKDEYEQAHPRS